MSVLVRFVMGLEHMLKLMFPQVGHTLLRLNGLMSLEGRLQMVRGYVSICVGGFVKRAGFRFKIISNS